MKIFRNFKEVQAVKPGFSVERIFGGALLGITGADFICFYDWVQAKVRLLAQAIQQGPPRHACRRRFSNVHTVSRQDCTVDLLAREPKHT